jgi:hypothetical protein
MASNIIPLKTNPGIKRDGTVFEGDYYVDGQWVRFQRGLPRKIGGVRAVGKYLPEICRGLHTYTQNAYIYNHAGSASYLSRFTLDKDNNSSVISDRTPVGFTADPNNNWIFDVMYSSVDTTNLLIAQVANDGDNIAKNTTGYIYTGDITGTAPLVAVSIPSGENAAGGIVCLHPYLFYFGDAGVVGWSVPGDPNDLTGSGSGVARVTGQKVVAGLPLRAGAGSAPAGIFWSYDAVIRATFTGGSTVFQFDTVASNTSIISKNSVIEYDGVFYWAGVDRFLMFNGVVREVQNSMNLNWFYDGLNPNYKEKIFAMKVPRYGEIWWCYPRGTATECTHAVIYNVRENTWYDTELPTEPRSAASFSQLYAAPITTGTTVENNGYNIWRHEIGTDVIDGLDVTPLQSYFETCDLSLTVLSGKNSELEISRIEPDFVQSGDMRVTVVGRMNARAPTVESNTVTFPADATQDPIKQTVMMKTQRRELRVRFESNVQGGDYQMGQVLLHVQPGDGTVLG